MRNLHPEAGSREVELLTRSNTTWRKEAANRLGFPTGMKVILVVQGKEQEK